MLKMDFINVGYGDAILIQELFEGACYSMLIDCGDLSVGEPYPGSKRSPVHRFLKERGIDSLDLFVVSHLHLDHIGGLASLLPEVRVKELWTSYLPERELWNLPPQSGTDVSDGVSCLVRAAEVFAQALREMEAAGTRFRYIGQDALIEPFPSGGVRLQLFSGKSALLSRQKEIFDHVLEGRPDRKELEELDGFINNTSIRIRLLYGKRQVELPGDACGGYWAGRSVSKCDLLKLPHHGHRDSMTPELLKKLSPDRTVISVSNDRTDDCPSEAILAMLSDAGCEILFTDAVQSKFSKTKFQESVSLMIDDAGELASSPV